MQRKLILAAKKLKQKIRKTPAKCRELWQLCSKERGVLVCRSIHIIFVIVTTVGTLPYRVEKLENGYRKFIPVKGLRKWLVNAMYTYMVLRSVSFALLPLYNELKLVVGGNLTADCLLWVLNAQIASVPAILCYKFGRNPWDVALIYNALGEVTRSVTRKHFKGKHIFELVDIHLAVVLILTSMSAVALLTPILSVPVFIPFRDSPSFLAYHIAGPYSEIPKHDIFRVVIYWICALVQWLHLNYIAWVMITLLILMGEGIIGCTILLKKIRSLELQEISWREKNKLHAQLEIILTVYNNWVGFAAPLTILAGLVFSVASIVTLMKMDIEMGFPKPRLIPLFIMFGAGGALGGGTIMKYAEELRANSIGYLQEVEAAITACMLLEVRGQRNAAYCPTGRTFRRQPTGVRMGSFMYIEEGLSTSYLMQIQDNAINYFFMVDLQSHPMWLGASRSRSFQG